ncbi:hypothetical protein JIN85_13320 [Luteolibacter pohnpeiensis]|uniref:Peptidase M10 metallopeptidase domain-containing protein n=1 Tax=Luteolibacter pohnpeiensis TaxID=454153 RepID=A0A934VWL3_9BACT|nr:hypothetical protein [Luteolibacter pohnpeiensis]MBK1883400.1 hypothetical protein [Luteolibacter pohnpeiensis]
MITELSSKIPKNFRCLGSLLFLVAGSAVDQAQAIEIQIDYRFDTANFFDTAEKKAAMESVAKFWGSMLQDHLLQIDASEFSQSSWAAVPLDPESGESTSISNLVVPEDTIIVFVGSRSLAGSTLGIGGPGGFSASGTSMWISRLRSRGNPGADYPASANDQKTDFAPWGGTIAFNRDRDFNFTSTADSSRPNFITIALHELGHVLGIGTAASWDNLISGTDFNGVASARSCGVTPSVTDNGGHFGETLLTSPFFGSFQTEHGVVGPILMRAATTIGYSPLCVATDLDVSALVDIGWEVAPPARFSNAITNPTSAQFSWPSSSFMSYQIEHSEDLITFSPLSPVIAGNKQIESWTDASPNDEKAFYRLVATALDVQTTTSTSNRQSQVKDSLQTASESPRTVTN